PWTQRTFRFDAPAGVFPAIVERLRGTPARAAALAAGWPEDVLGERRAGKWSAKDHIGHLAVLSEVDALRLDDFLQRRPLLSPADTSNPGTEAAQFPRVPMAAILDTFASRRAGLIRLLEPLDEIEVSITAVHQRLQTPIRLLDWASFVADHDDHHLAMARALLPVR
ncbi:MAG: DinB family protein, partial [Terriglobales bacterium]